MLSPVTPAESSVAGPWRRSVLRTNHGHESLNLAAVDAFQRVADLIPESIPIILETPVTADQIPRELRQAEAIFHAPVPA